MKCHETRATGSLSDAGAEMGLGDGCEADGARGAIL